MKRFLFLLLVLGVFNFSCKEESATSQIELISPEEMQEISQIEGVQLIDVRALEEYEEGFIEGFQNIDYFSDTFSQEIEKLDKSKPVVVYCRSGNRSGKCAKKMIEAGFSKIYDLDGGITQWQYEGYEVKESLN